MAGALNFDKMPTIEKRASVAVREFDHSDRAMSALKFLKKLETLTVLGKKENERRQIVEAANLLLRERKIEQGSRVTIVEQGKEVEVVLGKLNGKQDRFSVKGRPGGVGIVRILLDGHLIESVEELEIK